MEIDDDITYSNPFLLGDEGNGDPRLYLWFRGYGYGPTVASSDDLGGTWSEPLQVVSSPNTYGADGRTKQRPYVKYASNGKDTIHLIYTEGHPAEFANTSLYHLVYSHGELRRSDGTIVSSMTPAGGDPSLPPEAGTRIHDGAQSTAWVWDVALDRDEQPVVVYSAYENGTLAASYRYARFDGHAWVTSSIAPAGTALYGREKFYVGGISLDPDDTNIVYFSTNIDPSTGRSTGAHRELYRGVTRDNGASWAYAQLTHASTVENLRPVVPAHHSTARIRAISTGTRVSSRCSATPMQKSRHLRDWRTRRRSTTLSSRTKRRPTAARSHLPASRLARRIACACTRTRPESRSRGPRRTQRSTSICAAKTASSAHTGPATV
jgi:hypothetical protein